MKKYFPMILVLAVLILSACGVNKTETTTGTAKDKENPTTTSSKSLKELLGLGTSQKCTYEMNNDGEITKGEITVNGKKFKQITEIANRDGTMKVYAISDGIYYYSWSDAMKGNGTKTKIDELQANNQGTDNTNQNKQGVSMDQKVDYRCSPATLSESDLALPTDVKFLDYTEMIKGLQNGNLEDLEKLIPSQEE